MFLGSSRTALLVLVSLWGCANGNFSSGGNGETKPSSTQDEADGDELGQEEAADKPASVSGAYLTCAEQTSSSDDDVSYGCSLANETTQKPIPLAGIATQWKWRAVAPAGSPATLEIQVTEQSTPDVQVIYRFSGAGAVTRAYAEVTQIALDATLKEPLAGFDGFRKKLQETLTTTLSNPIDVGPDADGDRIPDSEDLCSNTPAGAYAHPDGEYVGCSAGQYRDADVSK
jgi:hypothetical protein